jgi:hypothetical protein
VRGKQCPRREKKTLLLFLGRLERKRGSDPNLPRETIQPYAATPQPTPELPNNVAADSVSPPNSTGEQSRHLSGSSPTVSSGETNPGSVFGVVAGGRAEYLKWRSPNIKAPQIIFPQKLLA